MKYSDELDAIALLHEDTGHFVDRIERVLDSVHRAGTHRLCRVSFTDHDHVLAGFGLLTCNPSDDLESAAFDSDHHVFNPPRPISTLGIHVIRSSIDTSEPSPSTLHSVDAIMPCTVEDFLWISELESVQHLHDILLRIISILNSSAHPIHGHVIID